MRHKSEGMGLQLEGDEYLRLVQVRGAKIFEQVDWQVNESAWMVNRLIS